MAFTTWENCRTDLKNAISNWAQSNPFTLTTGRGDINRTYRSVKEIEDAIMMTWRLEGIEKLFQGEFGRNHAGFDS